MTDRVLVTGVSGFIGSHVTERLLAKGYAVRGTVRNKAKGQKIVEALAAHGSDVSNLELVEANLASDAGWEDAVKECRYIQHIASPLPHDIVLTSSIAAMMGQPGKGAKMVLTENDWSDPDWKPMTSYPG